MAGFGNPSTYDMYPLKAIKVKMENLDRQIIDWKETTGWSKGKLSCIYNHDEKNIMFFCVFIRPIS